MKTPPPLTTCTVSAEDDGQRLDRYLKKAFPNLPFIGCQMMLRQGKIRINGIKKKGDARLATGDVITMQHIDNIKEKSDSSPYQLTKADVLMLESATVYEDNQLIILNKPAGLPAQAGGGQTRSLDRILTAFYPQKPPKLTHRLDRETTGLIVCAKNRTTAAAVTAFFAEKTAGYNTVTKTYLALVAGPLPGPKGSIKQPIEKQGPIARISPHGDFAHTTWQHLGSFTQHNETFHLLSCTPHTGRMNQIRVHMAHIGLPLIGDDKYFTPASQSASKLLSQNKKSPLYLHAWKLTFPHPATQIPLHVQAPLPPHFQAVFAACGLTQP